MRLRYVIVLLVVLAAVAAFAGKKLHYPEAAAAPAVISSPQAQSFLVILGVGDKAATNWDGSVTANGATILGLKGWRFSATDSISGTSTWNLAVPPVPPSCPPAPSPAP